MSNIQLARALGWTSLAVGATELAATRWLQEQLGVKNHAAVIRIFGGRELAAGLMILDQPGVNANLAAALWARVAGDLMDLAALGLARPTTRNSRGLSAITAIVLAATGVDLIAALRVQSQLRRIARISSAARRRVQPTDAQPRVPENVGSTTPDAL